MLGLGKGCPKRPAPPTEAASSHYTDCRLPASYDLSFSILIIYYKLMKMITYDVAPAIENYCGPVGVVYYRLMAA